MARKSRTALLRRFDRETRFRAENGTGVDHWVNPDIAGAATVNDPYRSNFNHLAEV